MLGKTSLVSMISVFLLALPAGCRPGVRTAPLDQPADQAEEPQEIVEEFWPDGKPRLHRQVLRSPDGGLVNDGTYTRWYDNGRKEYEAVYVRGQLHGVETSWHRNGQKRTEQHYDHGVRHGVRHDWDEQGRLRREEHYVKDRPHGTWTIWKPDGTVKWQARFDHGKPLP